MHSRCRSAKPNWICAIELKSSVPYLIRAINEWILDNGCTPYMIVDATMDDVSVPREHVKDGQIVLNISPKAIRDLSISDEYVMFSGRFAGVAHEISAPIGAVMGIIAKENGEGMWFPREQDGPDQDPEPPPDIPPDNPRGPPSLKVVK